MKIQIKKLIKIMISALAISLSATSPIAIAVPVNPIEWHFSVTTYGRPTSWSSYTNIISTYPQYNYEWQVTKVELFIGGMIWQDVTKYIPLNDRKGSGTFGHLPCEDKKIMPIKMSSIYTNLLLDVDSQGYGKVHIDDIAMIVDGARFKGDIKVTGVPEPATLVLLGMGGVWIFNRRKRTV